MVALGEAPAPLTKYQARPHSRPVKRSHAPPAAMPSRAPKRPRPSDGALESEKPAPAVRKKDGMKTVGKQAIKAGPPSPSKTLDGSSYRKTMFLSYLDDALAQRYQVRGRMCQIQSSSADHRCCAGQQRPLQRACCAIPQLDPLIIVQFGCLDFSIHFRRADYPDNEPIANLAGGADARRLEAGFDSRAAGRDDSRCAMGHDGRRICCRVHAFYRRTRQRANGVAAYGARAMRSWLQVS